MKLGKLAYSGLVTACRMVSWAEGNLPLGAGPERQSREVLDRLMNRSEGIAGRPPTGAALIERGLAHESGGWITPESTRKVL